jgi:mercuric ion transport protein
MGSRSTWIEPGTKMAVERQVVVSEQAAKGPLVGLGAAGGLVAAIGSLSCCVVPLALFSLGVSGAWIGNLTELSPYQPYFIAAALLFLGVGLWRVYRTPKVACADGTYCGQPRSRRLVKSVMWLSVVLVAAAVAFNVVAPYILPTD